MSYFITKLPIFYEMYTQQFVYTHVQVYALCYVCCHFLCFVSQKTFMWLSWLWAVTVGGHVHTVYVAYIITQGWLYCMHVCVYKFASLFRGSLS